MYSGIDVDHGNSRLNHLIYNILCVAGYVAVVGLPDPRKDHATVMVRMSDGVAASRFRSVKGSAH